MNSDGATTGFCLVARHLLLANQCLAAVNCKYPRTRELLLASGGWNEQMTIEHYVELTASKCMKWTARALIISTSTGGGACIKRMDRGTCTSCFSAVDRMDVLNSDSNLDTECQNNGPQRN